MLNCGYRSCQVLLLYGRRGVRVFQRVVGVLVDFFRNIVLSI